jgi:putative membrane protein
MIGTVTRIVGTGLALWVTTLIYKEISFGAKPNIATVLVIAAIFGLVNAFLKPALKIVSFPLSMMTLGLFGFVVNGVLLLVLAALAEAVGLKFVVGGFPPKLGADALISAVVGGVVLSLVSMVIDRLPFVQTSR